MQRVSAGDDEARMLVARVRTGTDLERRLASTGSGSHASPQLSLEVDEESESRPSADRDVAQLQNVLCKRPWFLALVVTVVVAYFLYVGLAFQYELPVA